MRLSGDGGRADESAGPREAIAMVLILGSVVLPAAIKTTAETTAGEKVVSC